MWDFGVFYLNTVLIRPTFEEWECILSHSLSVVLTVQYCLTAISVIPWWIFAYSASQLELLLNFPQDVKHYPYILGTEATVSTPISDDELSTVQRFWKAWLGPLFILSTAGSYMLEINLQQ